MEIQLNKAYEYYIQNIERSCNTAPLSFDAFSQAFPQWLGKLQMEEMLDGGEMNNNYKTQTNCGNWKFISLQRTINKLQ